MAYYVIIRGPLGSGKSTIATQLSRDLGAEHISIDKILDEFELTKDKEEGYISQKSFKRANEIAAARALPLLEKGKSVIFDGNFYWQSQLEDLQARLDFTHWVFTLKVPLEVCIERDEIRGRTHGPEAAKEVFKKSTSFEYGISIDVTKSLPDSVKEIESYIK